MRKIDYKTYLDKVYGCFQGKCISGTIGAPYEGMKQILNIQYAPELFENMLPNDDLDLQVLWLEVLEKKGVYFTSNDLADAFLKQCPYSPGEYAVFKKNYRRGLHPPVTGWFNNKYYLEGMGCPIRSEIWACLAPGNPMLASGLAAKDGIIDHSGNSVFAEQFLAVLEAEAFFENNIRKLIEIGLKHIPADSRIACLINDVMCWSNQSDDWKQILNMIIQKYGHPDCTNLFQNMGVIIMALLLGKMNFVDTTMMALNCGFDTDCTCATVGAVLGTIFGAEYLKREYGYDNQRYLLGVDLIRRSDSIFDLAEDICNMGIHFIKEINNEVQIEDYTGSINTPGQEELQVIVISVQYDGLPAIGIGEEKKLHLVFENNSEVQIKGQLTIEIPQGWAINEYQTELSIIGGVKADVELILSVPFNTQLLQETNHILVKFVSQEINCSYRFGVVGASVWKVYGPYWENNVTISNLKPGESYMDYIKGEGTDDTIDKIRNYHLNTVADFDKDYLDLRRLTKEGMPNKSLLFHDNCLKVNIYEDMFSVNDLVGFQGPCVLYMLRELISPENREVAIQIGHTDAFEFWINGRLLSRKVNVDWWTSENIHIGSVHLSKGVNRIGLKLARRSEKADFSISFLRKDGGMCGVLPFSEHYVDFASKA